MYTSDQLDVKTNIELRQIARNLGIAGMSRKRKNEVINAILAKQPNNGGSEFSEEFLSDKTKDEIKVLANQFGVNVGSRDTKATIINNLVENGRVVRPLRALSFGVRTTIVQDGNMEVVATVSCGANSGKWNVVGKTIGQISSTLREAINIPSNSDALVNGQVVDSTYVVENGDIVEYMKVAGVKG